MENYAITNIFVQKQQNFWDIFSKKKTWKIYCF